MTEPRKTPRSKVSGLAAMLERFAETYHAAIAAIDAEKPAEDAESCLSKMFRDIREIGYITEPLRPTNESHDACVYILAKYAETYHAERCKECVGKLPAFPHRVDFKEPTV